MKLTRRAFLRTSAAAGTSLALTQAVEPARLMAATGDPGLSPYLTGRCMAATPATNYRPYRSKPVTNASLPTWVQIDLGQSVSIEAVELYPASQQMFPGRDQYYSGEGFPLRFEIEAADDPEFAGPRTIADLSSTDFPDVADNITRFTAHGMRGRYVRLTATKLRAVKTWSNNPATTGQSLVDGPNFTLTIAKIGVISGGMDVAVGRQSTADPAYGNTEDLGQLTRAARQDGEQIHWDNPQNVTDPSSWKRQNFRARAPLSGVTIDDGVFRAAMENNIQYLLDSFSRDDLLRQFYERAGKVTNYKATGSAVFWEEDLAGSNAGRFLMGAANTVRWIRQPELQHRIEQVVDGIDACKESNGYIMAYPPDTIFYSERAAYTRAWLTHGLLEAGYAGNEKAFKLLRGYYDWFNQQRQYLPILLRGAIQGGQGMIANTRVSLSPVGRPDDVQVIQRYFEEPEFLKGIAARNEDQIWQYPYDRPHCYLLTNLEAYMDLYLATGDRHYYDAVLGAWELYRQYWEQPGGSISIIEFHSDPPGGNSLHEELGELCGSCFWVFLSQRFHQLDPDQERYMAEIEKCIYNVAIANQDGGYGLRYHTHLEGTKEKATRINSCCEGQGTRLLGSLPEHIYSVAPDGIYLNLYAPSAITWEQEGRSFTLAQDTKFPLANLVTCRVTVTSPAKSDIRIRIPSWASQEMDVKINGIRAGVGKPGSYLSIKRVWSNGDTVQFTLPAQLRATRYTGVDQLQGAARYSFSYGPILLAAVGASKIELDQYRDADDLIKNLEPVDAAPLHFRLPGNASLTFMPYWQVDKEAFSCFPAIRDEHA